MSDCIFCKIANGEIPSTKLYEDDDMIIIKDLNPQAPVHLLLIPKEHYANIIEMSDAQAQTLAKCIKKAELIAYEDLGAEALRKLYVEDMPLVVIIDSEGNNLYEEGRAEYLKGKK